MALDRARILAAALALLTQDGLEGLTMRRLAASLGVKAASLYWHYAGKQAQTATFEPTGCGRVLYTTYHSVPSEHVGLLPQERILAYLLMEIGVCTSDNVVE